MDIPNEKERMEALNENEGWEKGGDTDFDDFFPDYEKDVGRTIVGLFIQQRTVHRVKDGKPFGIYIIKTNEIIPDGERKGQNLRLAIRDYHIIRKELDKAKFGDGIKVTYEGRKDKEKGSGFYHSFIVQRKIFEPDQKLAEQPKTLVENDDPESINMIDHYKELYKDKNYGNEPTAKNILAEMNHDSDLTEEDKVRIKKQLAEMVKRNDIKE
jgi:hypothetical protein